MTFSGNELRVEEILKSLNCTDISQLFDQIPSHLLFPQTNMAEGLDEMALREHIETLAKKNPRIGLSFAGAGFYRHYIPTVVDYVSSLGSFATAYTPYQAEVSQGTLQILFEYQTYLAELTGMDVVNASHYDGATAFAEALRMLLEANKKRGKRIIIISTLNPEYREIIHTYLQCTAAEIDYLDIFQEQPLAIPPDCCAVSVILPDYYGRVADISALSRQCREAGVFLHIHGDPLLCAVTTPPGILGADVYTGEGQCLGIPVNMGGPYLGIFAVSAKFPRKMPGRVVGETSDQQNRRGFVLALSAREQHIRRAKASSNICTNQGLMALKALVYMAAMGRDGLQTVAKRCISNTHYLMGKLATIQGVTVLQADVLHFREFVISCEFPIERLVKAGEEAGMVVGVALDANTLLVSTTEVHKPEDLDAYIALCKRVAENEQR